MPRPYPKEFREGAVESFFAALKKELIHRASWERREQLRVAVFDYIEIFYNAARRHSTLGMLSPADFEQATIDNNLENNLNQGQIRVSTRAGEDQLSLFRGSPCRAATSGAPRRWPFAIQSAA